MARRLMRSITGLSTVHSKGSAIAGHKVELAIRAEFLEGLFVSRSFELRFDIVIFDLKVSESEEL